MKSTPFVKGPQANCLAEAARLVPKARGDRLHLRACQPFQFPACAELARAFWLPWGLLLAADTPTARCGPDPASTLRQAR